MRNGKLLATIVNEKSYVKYNPEISFKVDQKITLISNVSPLPIFSPSMLFSTLYAYQHINSNSNLFPLEYMDEGTVLFSTHISTILVYKLQEMLVRHNSSL